MFKTWGRILIWIGNSMESRIHVQNTVPVISSFLGNFRTFPPTAVLKLYIELLLELLSGEKAGIRIQSPRSGHRVVNVSIRFVHV